MQFQFSFKHMEGSPALTSYSEEKLTQVIRKFVTKPIEVQLTFSVDRHMQQATCVIIGGDGFSLNVEHSCSDMYGSVDHLADKLANQLKRKKDRLKSHKVKQSPKKLAWQDHFDQAEDEYIDALDIIKFERARKNRAV